MNPGVLGGAEPLPACFCRAGRTAGLPATPRPGHRAAGCRTGLRTRARVIPVPYGSQRGWGPRPLPPPRRQLSTHPAAEPPAGPGCAAAPRRRRRPRSPWKPRRGRTRGRRSPSPRRSPARGTAGRRSAEGRGRGDGALGGAGAPRGEAVPPRQKRPGGAALSPLLSGRAVLRCCRGAAPPPLPGAAGPRGSAQP